MTHTCFKDQACSGVRGLADWNRKQQFATEKKKTILFQILHFLFPRNTANCSISSFCSFSTLFILTIREVVNSGILNHCQAAANMPVFPSAWWLSGINDWPLSFKEVKMKRGEIGRNGKTRDQYWFLRLAVWLRFLFVPFYRVSFDIHPFLLYFCAILLNVSIFPLFCLCFCIKLKDFIISVSTICVQC